MLFTIIAGILLLYFGAEALIKGGSSLALRLNIKPLVIGLTVIAFGTSSPELVVSIKAVLTGHSDISAGDIIGSSIFNVAGILSFCTLFRAIPINKQILKFDLPFMLLAYVLFSIFVLIGIIPQWMGIIFVLFVVAYTIAIYLIPKRRVYEEREAEAELEKPPLKNIYLDVLYILGGLAALIYGGDLLVKGAIYLAKLLNTNEARVALGIVALSTSIPEITLCLVALRRKKYDLLVGNIVGSNIYNIFFVVGTAAAIGPYKVENIRLFDLGMLLATGVLIYPFFRKDLVFSRIKGLLLFASYVFYLFLLMEK